MALLCSLAIQAGALAGNENAKTFNDVMDNVLVQIKTLTAERQRLNLQLRDLVIESRANMKRADATGDYSKAVNQDELIAVKEKAIDQQCFVIDARQDALFAEFDRLAAAKEKYREQRDQAETIYNQRQMILQLQDLRSDLDRVRRER